MAAGSAARRLQLSCTGAGSTQSSVQKQQAPTKDLADKIRALLKQSYRSDSPRQVEGTWQYINRTLTETSGSRHRSDHLKQIEGTRQYIRRHLAANREVTSPDRLKVLGSTLEALGSRQCSPATATLPHRSRNNTEFSPKNSRTLQRIWRTKSGPY